MYKKGTYMYQKATYGYQYPRLNLGMGPKLGSDQIGRYIPKNLQTGQGGIRDLGAKVLVSTVQDVWCLSPYFALQNVNCHDQARIFLLYRVHSTW